MRWRRPESCGGVERIRNPVSNGTFISEIYFGVIRPAGGGGVRYHGGDFGSDVLYCTSPCRVLRNRPASSTVDQLVNFGYWLRTSAGSINGPVKMGLGVSQGGHLRGPRIG